MPVFSNKWSIVVLAAIIGVLIWNQFREREHALPRETQRALPVVTPSPPPSFGETPPSSNARIPAPSTTPTAATSVPSDVPHTTAGVLPGSVNENPAAAPGDISEDLSGVDSAIRDYRTVHGENPVGSNAEITTALFINNPKQIKLEVPSGSSINSEGQLCDRWGTPYFFHQLSASEMEIRSAGPDRTMWTGDDSKM